MKKFVICLAVLFTTFLVQGQRKTDSNSKPLLSEASLNGLKFRSVGPALTSGRISDFAVNPDNPKEYYVATSSGGVWKTSNSGIEFKPIFDKEGSYSIGCVSLDPNNPNVVWVGTGENNSQRSVAYGDGVYKSIDGGSSWQKMGLENSAHIGKIIIDPTNSNVVYVAAMGPLWSAGGDRGMYKTTDGGKTWKKILEIDEHTGVSDIIIDPRNSNVLYASAYQRRRHVFTYLGGGPGSGLYKSENGGNSWDKINKGLPSVDMGRIGLAIAPSDPEYLYAIVEAAQGKGGVFRSTNRGATWEKRGSYSTAGLYYQEIFVDPLDKEKLYAMDVWARISKDGGKTFKVLGEVSKHVDNHCIWIDPNDTDHLLMGCDGGIYETWDAAKSWDFKPNLPITQFYKVAVDNDEPFYNIYGGTQDNFSIGGPSRSINGNGISNEEWIITNGGDGFESQIDPENPNIVYAQSQYGYLVRFDKASGERIGIKPQERKGENQYRWNWDAPLVISKHNNQRIYFAANKVFRSDDRGNSWEVISEDLTRQINRNELPVMGRIWGIDAVAKNGSTSPYGTIVAMDESALNEDLIIVGTDDGLIQISTNSGQTWTRKQSFAGVPDRTYVNMVLASQHDENTIYACFNNHKNGDFKPYVYVSKDKGQTWKAISSNLPVRGSTYSIAEDHLDPNLLFVGTEFGVFVSNNGGTNWHQLKGGLPTISVRDMAIQTRESDLILGTFGRGFYVLDDYSALRSTGNNDLSAEAKLFSVRDPLLYEYSYPLGLPFKSFQGDNYYQGENLPSCAIFTYYVKDDILSLAATRRNAEKDATSVTYPNYEDLDAERSEKEPQLIFTVRNEAGKTVRKIYQKPSKGINRVMWDLRYSDPDPVKLSKPSFYNPWSDQDLGILVKPGQYTVTLSKSVRGVVTDLSEPVVFNVKALNNTTLPSDNRVALDEFNRKVLALKGAVGSAQQTLREINNQIKHIAEAIKRSETDPTAEMVSLSVEIENRVREMGKKLNSDPVARTLDIGTPPTVGQRVGTLAYSLFGSTSQTTKTNIDSFTIASEEFVPILEQLNSIVKEDLPKLQQLLLDSGAPYTPYSIPGVPEFKP